MTENGERGTAAKREVWPRPRWVCPHDPAGNDHDTAIYCPQAVLSTRRFGATDD
jgi:hypothetical protein